MSERENNKDFEVAEILIGLRTLIKNENNKNDPKYKYQVFNVDFLKSNTILICSLCYFL